MLVRRLSIEIYFTMEERDNLSQKSRAVNAYLEVQEACDVKSMVAYHFVGFVLDKLAKIKGLELYRGDRFYLNGYFQFLKMLKVTYCFTLGANFGCFDVLHA